MEITASQVKELREKTGVGLMDCKKALAQSGGVIEDAVKYLRERGLAAAAKKADRSANEGKIFTGIASNGSKGVMVEVNCETDFVANNEAFISFGQTIADYVLNNDVNSVEELNSTKINEIDFQAFKSEVVLKVGENIDINKLTVFKTEGSLFQYVHMNGKIGVLVCFSQNIDSEIGKDVAMQIAAASPLHIKKEDVTQEEISRESEIIRNQALNEGKPEQIVEKIVQGRLGKYYKEVCLLEQSFVKDTNQTVQQIIPANATVDCFERYSLG
jgi:elongation factor Ts